MKFGEIYTYRNAKEAEKYIGKKGAFSECLLFIEKIPKQCEILILKEIVEESTHPFTDGREVISQFFRPILEDEELMTNRQLAEWLAKGNGEYAFENGALLATHFSYGKSSVNDPVEDYVIRRWGDTEWSKPTRAIYEEDCMPNTAINKEDCK